MTVYSPSGAVLDRVALPAGTFAGFALLGAQLATVRNDTLELYDLASGARLKAIAVASGSVLRGLEKGLAVLVRGRKIYVLRVSDGKRITFSPPGSGSVDAQLGHSGLFYFYNRKSAHSPGRVVFVPRAQLLKKLR